MVFFRGATSWELQIGRLYVTVPYWRFWRAGSEIRIGWDVTED